ncbi:VOC family protein [Nocardiopsis lambiniae]|uniref:VOC family protein n=1 Tax=Nocardiopsis lambiniae TaxID=3075539 RepID=A0ABU2MD36_9ACTN|nr:VOC family protein [Nocardiopsis sp. DSM 44743]MDT0330589.1 VOC family protein [Nocardiopsis sp. DSM 44743]
MSTGAHLAADTSMGAVTLNVADLDTMTAYHRDGVGLTVLEQTGPKVTLGRPGRPVVVLVRTPEPRYASPGEAGLFHTDILLDTEAALAAALDERGLTREPIGDARVGHIHLSVGDVATARDFYATRLGFDVTLALGDQAVFVSAGGYHHHMAMNVWKSGGAGRRQQTLGLGRVDIEVLSDDDVGELTERMRHYRIPIQDDGATVRFEDPWANTVRLSTASHPKGTESSPNSVIGPDAL